MMLIALLLSLPSNAFSQDPNNLPVMDITIDGDEAIVRHLKTEYIPYLKNVRKLEICSDLSSKLPDLSELKNLSELTIEHTQVIDISSLVKLPQLVTLTLSRNPINDLSPVSQLPNLKKLKLDYMEITELSFLSKMTGLEHLSITDQDNHEMSLTPLANLKSLKSLTIQEKRLVDISAFAHLNNLEKINLSSNGISDISFLAGMPNLKQIDLDYNQISNISTLALLPNLSVLSLTGNPVQDISPLAKLDNLDVLLMYGNYLNEDAHKIYLPQLIKKNPDILINCYVKTGNPINDFKLPLMIVLYILIVVCTLIWLRKKKHKKFIYLLIAVVILTLVPLPVRDKDIEKVIKQSVNSLIDDQRIIMLNRGYIPFYDSRAINKYRRLSFINDINIDDGIYKKLKLEPYDEDKDAFAFDKPFQNNVIIEFTYQNVFDSKKTNSIHFNYYQGPLAAQGHRVIIYRNAFGVFPLYIFQWVS